MHAKVFRGWQSYNGQYQAELVVEFPVELSERVVWIFHFSIVLQIQRDLVGALTEEHAENISSAADASDTYNISPNTRAKDFG